MLNMLASNFPHYFQAPRTPTYTGKK